MPLSSYRHVPQDIEAHFREEGQIQPDYHRRFVYELIQNADDALEISAGGDRRRRLKFELRGDVLLVANNGRPITGEDVQQFGEASRLEKLFKEFRDELSKSNSPTVSYDQVEAARNELHEYASMAEVLILAEYPGLDEDSAHRRESLLAPMTEQQERVLEAQRRRRRLRDVDPETGEEVDEIVAPDEEPVTDDEPATGK